MKHLTAGIALTTLALLATATTANAEVSAASPTSDFGGTIDAGFVDGTFTWYGRSVGVSGTVYDRESAGSTTVVFEFRHGNSLIDVQTRTAADGPKKFGWTEPGPVGGISKVDLYLKHDGHQTFVASFRSKA